MTMHLTGYEITEAYDYFIQVRLNLTDGGLSGFWSLRVYTNPVRFDCTDAKVGKLVAPELQACLLDEIRDLREQRLERAARVRMQIVGNTREWQYNRHNSTSVERLERDVGEFSEAFGYASLICGCWAELAGNEPCELKLSIEHVVHTGARYEPGFLRMYLEEA